VKRWPILPGAAIPLTAAFTSPWQVSALLAGLWLGGYWYLLHADLRRQARQELHEHEQRMAVIAKTAGKAPLERAASVLSALPGTAPDLARIPRIHQALRLSREEDGGMHHFIDDDTGYLEWINRHQSSYVLNTTRNPSAAYLKLHRATCWTINRLQPRASTFTGEYSKVCGDRHELQDYARSLGRSVQACGHCL
jgi:hypothetical protein